MLKINFIKDSDREDRLRVINKGLNEYKEIWIRDGQRIVEELEKVSGLKFKENEINAIVFESSLRSRSFPLSLSASIPTNIKSGLLVHELCHRLLSGNRVRIKVKEYKDLSLEIHKVLNLILYDAMLNLYGKDKTKELIKWESSSRTGIYKEAWDWVLAYDKKARTDKFQNFIEKQNI